MKQTHTHHRNRDRSYNEPKNLLELDPVTHELVHKFTGEAYDYGLLVHSWDDPAETVADVPGFLREVGSRTSADVEALISQWYVASPALEGRTPVGTGSDQGGEEPMQTTVTGEEVPHRHVVNEQGVEKPCTKCHGTGKIIVKAKPAEKKERSENSPIYNARTPKGHSREVLEEDEEQITDLLVKSGILRGHQGARWWVIHYAYRFVLMNARAFVTDLTKGEGGE